MTTIAFRDGIMAADSMISSGNTNVGGMVKAVRLADGTLIGAAGSAADMAEILKWAEAGMEGRPPKSQNGASALVAFPDGRVGFIENGMPFYEAKAPFFALGSGEDLAIGAMAAGATALEAVRIAAKFDKGTGGDILTLRIEGPHARPLPF